MTDLDELERLAREATPGPWIGMPKHKKDGEWVESQVIADDPDRCIVFSTCYDYPKEQADADVVYVAAAVNALPELIAEVRRLREAYEFFSDALERAADDMDRMERVVVAAEQWLKNGDARPLAVATRFCRMKWEEQQRKRAKEADDD